MTQSALYDDDFLLWTEQQAEALRQLGPSNSLDIDHLAEEIEDLGKRDLRDVQSFLRQILTHLLKIAMQPDSEAVRHWRAEILNFKADLENAFSPSMRQNLQLGKIWRQAVEAALDASLRDETARKMEKSKLYLNGLPLTLDDLLDFSFEIDTLLARLTSWIAGNLDQSERNGA